jgi:hypothetical protein
MLEREPWSYADDKAGKLRVILADILKNLSTILG